MLSFIGLLFYLVLEFLRPENVFPSTNIAIMSGVAAFTAVMALLESPFRASAGRCASLPYLAGFLVAGTISTALTGETAQIYQTMGDLLKILIIFMVLVKTVNTERKLNILLLSMLSMILLLSVQGIFFANGYWVRGFSWDREHRLQYSGIFEDSNDLGQLYATGFALWLFKLVNRKGYRRLFFLLALSVTGWSIYLTQSRGAILGVLLAVVLAFRSRIGIAKPAVIALVILIILNQAGVARMDKLSSNETSAEGRLEAWGQGWYMLRSNPLFGVGPLNFTHYHPRAAHSSLVQVAAETGLIGLFCWIGVFYLPLRDSIESLWRSDRSPPVGVAELQSGLLVCFATGMFLSRGYLLFLFILAGMVLVARNMFAEEDSSEEAPQATFSMGIMRVVQAQLACMLIWRIMARHFINGI